jgi:predicted site-specific integrase-resolvase
MDVQTLIDRAGGLRELMARLGVARTTVLDWKRTGTIPATRVAQISEELRLPLRDVVKLASRPAVRKVAAE